MKCPKLAPMLMWNPINFVDAEGRWLAVEVALVFGAFIFSKILGLFASRFAKRCANPFVAIGMDALHKPALGLLWYLVSLTSFDLASDQLLSSGRPQLWAVAVNGASVLSVGWFLLRLKNSVIDYVCATRKADGKLTDAHFMLAFSKLLTVVIAILVIVLLHDVTGMNLTTFLAFGGVGGLALAFASQDIVSNFFGGFMIHLTRPFFTGEQIAMPATCVEGFVEEIGWYQTRIRSMSRSALYIPNSLFTKALLINKSRITHQLFEEPLAISMAGPMDLRRLLAEIARAITSHPKCDRAEWAGARIRSFHGNTCELTIHSLVAPCPPEEFHTIRNELFIACAEVVLASGGAFVPSSININSALSRT